MLLGILVAVLGFFALMMWVDARHARDAADRAAASVGGLDARHGHVLERERRLAHELCGSSARQRRRARHRSQAVPGDATWGTTGRNGRGREPKLTDLTVQIAPGVKYSAWAWAGGAPGPVIHVHQGQMVKITLTNKGAIPHSVDFHAARVAPDKAFTDVMPGQSVSYMFRANDPGVFMYHCGTKPVLMHIANGMYGAIVVEPRAGMLPKADRDYVLVASEWYLSSNGLDEPAVFDMAKAHARQPDWMTFNGYAGQYVKHPLTAKPGELVRFWVVDAGPSLDTDFHIVGTILDTAYPFGDMRRGGCAPRRADGHRAGRRRRSLRREDRPARALPLRLARLRRGGPGPGGPPERRQRPRDDVSLALSAAICASQFTRASRSVLAVFARFVGRS